MAKVSLVAGTSSYVCEVFVQDSSSTTGAGLTGVAFNASGLVCYYKRSNGTASVSSTINTITTLGTYAGSATNAGWKEVDATNMPGVYEINVPNNALASGAKSAVVMFKGVTNMAPLVMEFEITATDNQDAVHGGMSALPNTAVTTNASLLTSGTGTDQLSVASGRIDVGKALGTAVTLDTNNVLNVSTKYVGGTLQTARDIGANVLLSAGTGTGQLDFTSGVVKANATQWLGGTIPAVNVTGVPLVDAKYLLGTIFSTPTVAGIPNVNAKTWNDLSTVALPLVPTVAGRALDVSAGGEAGLDWANIGSPTTTNNLSGTTISAAGSISGSVASVTGNVGGNVVGSVGSVVAGVTVTTNNDKTGYALSSAGVQAIWDALTSALTTVGSIGKLLVTNIDATISSRLASASYTTPPTANENADGLLDRANAVETGLTPRGLFRLTGSVLGGKLSGGGTGTEVFRNAVSDSKARLTATDDSSGNRTAIVYDLT